MIHFLKYLQRNHGFSTRPTATSNNIMISFTQEYIYKKDY